VVAAIGAVVLSGGPSSARRAEAFMVPTATGCPLGMAAISGGTFVVGATSASVTLKPFCLDVHEVTIAEYGPCVDAGACAAPSEHIEKDPNHQWQHFCNWGAPGRSWQPVNCVDWFRADAYCTFVHRRLPTAEEFEWAARNGDAGDEHPWGAGPVEGKVTNACGSECVQNAATLGLSWLSAYPEDDGWPETAPVGSFRAGDDRWGVHDLVGNMSEWTATEDAGRRVLMGGNWSTYGHEWLNAHARDPQAPSENNSAYGFRCAL